MKLKGTSSSLTLTCDDDQTIVAQGELLTGGRFLVYADSLPPDRLAILKKAIRQDSTSRTITILFDDE